MADLIKAGKANLDDPGVLPQRASRSELGRHGACFLRKPDGPGAGPLYVGADLRKPANQYLLRSVLPRGGGGDPAVQSAMQFAMYCSFSG